MILVDIVGNLCIWFRCSEGCCSRLFQSLPLLFAVFQWLHRMVNAAITAAMPRPRIFELLQQTGTYLHYYRVISLFLFTLAAVRMLDLSA